MEKIDKLTTIGRCKYAIDIIKAAKAMLGESRFDGNGNAIQSKETEEIIEIENELSQICNKIDTFARNI